MQTQFTPFLSLGGGMLIGLSAVLLMATNGKIAGISGIVSRILAPNKDRSGLMIGIAFVVGLLIAAPLYKLVTGGLPASIISPNIILLICAGLLVGFGSATGNGCTSGHGVCGISRFSTRSIAATLIFMATAFITVFIMRHILGV